MIQSRVLSGFAADAVSISPTILINSKQLRPRYRQVRRTEELSDQVQQDSLLLICGMTHDDQINSFSPKACSLNELATVVKTRLVGTGFKRRYRIPSRMCNKTSVGRCKVMTPD